MADGLKVGHNRPDDAPPDGSFRHADLTDEALDWFVRLRDDDATETIAAFERWRAEDPRHREAYDHLLQMHAMPSLRRATIRDAERLGLAAEKAAIAMPVSMPRRPSRRNSVVGAMAAMLLVAVGWHEFPSLALQWRSDYRTAVGERQTVTLPDGSVAVLNTGSALAIDFEDGQRRVTLLDGEAFFDVRHDASHPFVVTGRFSSVEVKGTAFAVLTDGAEDVVTLARGRVDVTRNGDAAGRATLEPGQMIVASASGLSSVRNADIDDALAWRDGRIVFHDRPFGRALESLERYYDGSVVTLAGDLDARRVSGNYRTDEPEIAIRTLARSAGLSVTRLPGGTLILR